MINKVVIVTGASRGIGREIAISLAQDGFSVIANYNKSEELAHELKKYNIDIFKADISKRENVQSLAKYVLNKYGKIDILINNAGISKVKLFTEVSDDDWKEIINTNLYSAFCMTQEVLPNMIHNKSGCIINISSIWGQIGASCESIYSISKAGLDAMTKSLAKELGPSNIRVNSVSPGFIDTSMNSNLSDEEKNNILNDIPLRKLGKPTDIANCVKWLVNDNYTTGQVICVNGGWA